MPAEVDKTLLGNYRLFILQDLGNKENSVGNHLRHLHQVTRRVLQEQYAREDPFKLINIETSAYEHNTLTMDDLQKLLAYHPRRSTDNHYRLTLLLGYFTGLVFLDLKKPRMDDVYTPGDGRRYVSLCQTKIQNRSIVPLLPVVEKIFAIVSHGRREGLFFRESSSNNNLNKTIQEVYIEAGLLPHTQATLHTAWYTFATTICPESGLPIEAVSKMLGYHSISTIEIYARVIKSEITKEM